MRRKNQKSVKNCLSYREQFNVLSSQEVDSNTDGKDADDFTVLLSPLMLQSTDFRKLFSKCMNISYSIFSFFLKAMNPSSLPRKSRFLHSLTQDPGFRQGNQKSNSQTMQKTRLSR